MWKNDGTFLNRNVSTYSSPLVSSYAGVNRDRQSYFEARSARRWGDWGILEVPAPVLWLDDIFAEAVLEDALIAPLTLAVDLWP